jgi:hypothetical protein
VGKIIGQKGLSRARRVSKCHKGKYVTDFRPDSPGKPIDMLRRSRKLDNSMEIKIILRPQTIGRIHA